MIPSHIHCTVCKTPWEVSAEDPDATFDDAVQHLRRRHPWADPAKAIREGQPTLGES